MMLHFSVLGAPLLRAAGIPLVTWYAHPSLNRWVKLADAASDGMVTSLANTYPWRRDKLTVIGQGIDADVFRADGESPEDDLVLCAGRVSPLKDHATLLRAAARLARKPRIVILGHAATAADSENLARLREISRTLGLAERVAFEPGVPQPELPAWYRRCAVHVNLTPSGFGDKVALEAMACGRPCLVANTDFAETLGRWRETLLFRPGDPADLASKLEDLLGRSRAERQEIGMYLRSQVERLHGLPQLARRILELLEDHACARG
jgi:glycosyltransferase involved in cell wall biosynthesis